MFNLGRTEVQNFLIASALYWLREFHVDGLRVDAVASILYRDYSRKDGEWIPNRYGGRENLEAVAFLKRFNTIVYGEVPGITTFAEESTAWPGVTLPVDLGGLGFGYKWNMGWMHDTLRFFERDPLFRGHHLDDVSFGLVYAFSENFVLPLSHDEVVHGKRSLLGRMPGAEDQQFANLRLLYALMWSHPGKKLLFAGGESASAASGARRPRSTGTSARRQHRGVQRLVTDLNALGRSHGGAARARLRAGRIRLDRVRRLAQRGGRVRALGRRPRRARRVRVQLQRSATRGLRARRAAADGLPRAAQHRRRSVRRHERG